MTIISIDKILDNKKLPCWLPVPTCVDTLSDIVSLNQFDQKWNNTRFLPWRFFYVDYQVIQQEILNRSDKNIIAKKLQDDWTKVHEFYMLKRGEIDRRIMSLQDQKRSITFSSTIKSLILEILHLYQFAKLNYCGFLQLFMQFDRLLGSSVHLNDELRKLIIKKPFWKHSLEYHRLAIEVNYLYVASSLIATKPLLLQQYKISTYLNALQQDCTKVETEQNNFCSHVALPQQESNVNNNALEDNNTNTLSSSPSSCSIHSCETTLSSEISLQSPQHHTYWVHPNNVLEIMLYLSNKMMVVQDNISTTTAYNEIGYPNRNSISEDQYKMTTLYMDTPQLSGYTQRLNNQDTLMTHVRWYDSITSSGTNNSASHVMIEQKVYDTEQFWVQQRVWLKSKHLQPWLNGTFSLGNLFSKNSCQYNKDGYRANSNDICNMRKSCLFTEKQIHTEQIQPVLKVTQNRIVYTSINNSVTISIDSDIAMMRAFPTEKMENTMANSVHQQQQLSSLEAVDQYPYNSMRSDSIVRFPYCVIQINTSTDNAENNDKWLLELMKCSMLTPVDKFSTYLHGVGTLFKDMPLPNWVSISIDDIRHESLIQGQTPQQQQQQQKQQHGITTKNSLDSMQTTTSGKSSSSSSRDTHYCSTNTIATIITCYDDEIEEKQQIQQNQVESSTVLSPLLHPQDGYRQQRNRIRRSFDSYCSFDHPTSSRSDPTNCKNCMGRMLFIEHQNIDMMDCNNLPISVCEKETITFSSFLLQTFWPRKFRSFEKEPLLAHHQHKKYRSISSSSSFCSSGSSGRDGDKSKSVNIALSSQNQSTQTLGERFSRASILTMTCVVMSFSMSYILYITVLAKL